MGGFNRLVGSLTAIVFTFSFIALGAAKTAAVPATITDNAGFFTKDAIKRANEEIKEVKRLFKKDILIETVASVPIKDEKNLSEDSKELDPLFSEWAKKRLNRTGKNNIYVVISRNPSYIMAAVGSETRTKGEFTENDRNSLIRLLADSFQTREYNKGLLDSIRFIRGSMDHNINGAPAMAKQNALPPPAAPDVSFLWRWIGFGCAALLALLLITGLVRGFKTPIVPTQENNPT